MTTSSSTPGPAPDLAPLDPGRRGGEPVDRQPDDEAGLYDLVEQVRRIRALSAEPGPVTVEYFSVLPGDLLRENRRRLTGG
ncbi:hypothetical protein [Dietzia sp. 179-F 9C3 NHS]|uniref:hypothetical protein n=1 Tax=Dietzia sp. 179-F 9C3 NHS TaxID=3374295 RepID=UPI003879129F